MDGFAKLNQNILPSGNVNCFIYFLNLYFDHFIYFLDYSNADNNLQFILLSCNLGRGLDSPLEGLGDGGHERDLAAAQVRDERSADSGVHSPPESGNISMIKSLAVHLNEKKVSRYKMVKLSEVNFSNSLINLTMIVRTVKFQKART